MKNLFIFLGVIAVLVLIYLTGFKAGHEEFEKRMVCYHDIDFSAKCVSWDTALQEYDLLHIIIRELRAELEKRN
jgi:hypothetical protein